MPVIDTAAGLKGSGTGEDPLGIDFSRVATSLEGSRLIEAEKIIGSNATVGANTPDATASAGGARFGAANGTSPGILWSVTNTNLGLLGTGRTRVTVRAKVTNNSSTATLATLRCYATRNGTTTPTEVGTAVAIKPSGFSAGRVWKELDTFCNYLPDDVSQSIEVANFVVGMTDLSIDYARIERGSNADRLSEARLQDLLWGLQHAAAVAACRALDSNQGCCARAVMARNTNVSCNSICAASGWVCKSEVSVMAYPGQAGSGNMVGSYYNYGCSDTSGNPRGEPQRPGDFRPAIDDGSYHTYCCCGPN